MISAPLEAARGAAVPVHRALDLLGPDGTARILLNDQTYTLRLTRAGKLILTK
jgi:hemin uptake protein HemP